MNTIQIGNSAVQIDISKFVKDTVEQIPENEIQSDNIDLEIPTKGTKQYDELKTTLINAKIPVTDENIKTASLMVKSGIDLQLENIEAVADIKKQVEYVVNHINDTAVKSVLETPISLDKITVDILENMIKDVTKNQSEIPKNPTKAEIKEAVDKYKNENSSESDKDLDIEKCIENLLKQSMPITDKNIQSLQNVVSKTKEIENIDREVVIKVLKKDKPVTIENLYIEKYSVSKSNAKAKKNIAEKDWKELVPQIEKIVDSPKFKDKTESVKVAKLLLENDVPITSENISKVIAVDDLKSNGVDRDMLLQEAAHNLKHDNIVSDIELNQIIKSDKNQNAKNNKSELQKDISQSESQNVVSKVEYDLKKQQYYQISKEIQSYDDDVINHVLNSGKELTLENLHIAFEQLKSSDSTDNLHENSDGIEFNPDLNINSEFKENIQKQLQTVTAKRQIAEIRLRLTSDAVTMLMQKGIDIDTMPLKDAVEQLKSIERDLYKSQLEMAGADASEENIDRMSDLYNKLADMTDLKANTYQEIVHKDIPFTVTSVAEADRINTKNEVLQLQQASEKYDSLQTQPNPKFKEGFGKVSNLVPPLLESLGIEATDENVRAAKILVRNKMEVNEQNILDIKLVDTKVTEVTTQLHPTIAANMIRDGLRPADMHIDEVLKYMDNFKELLGEDLTSKIAQYIYDMDRAGEITEPERESMIGIYRMLYTIDKTQGRATGFIVKNNMDLTLNNLMEASHYYDRTSAKYSDIDVKIDDEFGALEKVIVNPNSIKSQMNRAYELNETRDSDTNNVENSNSELNTDNNSNVELNSQNSDKNYASNREALNRFLSSIKADTVVKMIDENVDFENISIENLNRYIDRENSKTDSKPIADMDTDEIISYSNTIENSDDRDRFLKLYSVLKSVKTADTKLENILKDESSNINLNSLKDETLNIPQNVKSEALNKIAENLNIDTVKQIIKENADIYSIPIEKLAEYVEKSDSEDTATLQNIESKMPILNMTKSEIENYVENDTDRENILKLYDILKDAQKVNKRVESNRNDTKIDVTNESLNKIAENLNIDTVKQIIKDNVDIYSVPIEKLAEYVEKSDSIDTTTLQNIETKLPILNMTKPEIESYMGNDADRENILKLYDILKDVQKINKRIEPNRYETEINVKNESLNKIVENLNVDTVKQIAKENNDIYSISIEKLAEYVEKSENIDTTTLQNIESKMPILNMTKSEIESYVENDADRENILKLYDILNNVQKLNRDIKSESKVNVTDKNIPVEQTKIEALNNIAENLSVDTIKNVMYENVDIYNIPIEKVVEYIDKSENKNIDRNDSLQSTELKTNLADMNPDRVLEYEIDNLNKEDMDNILKLHTALNTLKNKILNFKSDAKTQTVEVESQKNSEIAKAVLDEFKIDKLENVTLKDLIYSVENLKEESEVGIYSDTYKTLNKVSADTVANILESKKDIENIPVKELVEIIKNIEADIIPNGSNSIVSMSEQQISSDYNDNLLRIQKLIQNVKNSDKIKFNDNIDMSLKQIELDMENSASDTDEIQLQQSKLRDIVEKLDLDTAIEIVKNNDKDIDNILEYINNKSIPTDRTEKLSQMSIEDILKHIDTNVPPDESTEVLKLYTIVNTIKNRIGNISEKFINSDSEITLDSVEIAVDEIEKSVELKETSNSDLLNLMQKLKVSDLNRISNQYDTDIEYIPIDEILKSINQAENEQLQNLKLNVRNRNLNENSISEMNLDEILKSANEYPKLKSVLLKIHRAFDTIESMDEKDIADNFKSYDSLNDIENISDRFLHSKEREENRIKNLEKIDKLIKNLDLDTAIDIVKNFEDLENTDIDSVLKHMDKPNSGKAIVNMSADEIAHYIQDNSFTYEQKQKLFEIYKTANVIQDTSAKAVETVVEYKSDITFDNLLKSVDTYTKAVDLNKYNEIQNFIRNLKADTVVEFTKQNGSMDFENIQNILEYQNIIENTENRSEIADKVISDMDIDEIVKYVSDKPQSQKQEIFKLYNLFQTIKNMPENEFRNISLDDGKLTIDSLTKVVYEFERNFEAVDTHNNSVQNSNIETQLTDTVNRFVEQARPEIVSELVQKYGNLNSTPMNTVLEYMQNLKPIKSLQNRFGLKGINSNIINRTINLKSQKTENRDDVENINSAIKDVQNIETKKVVETILKSVNTEDELTVEKFINAVKKVKSENDKTGILEQQNVNSMDDNITENLSEQQIKQFEYERSVINKFIQKAEPEIIAKLLKQIPSIENMPVESILKSMESIVSSNIGNSKSTDNTVKANEFIENLNRLSSVEPTTMLWMQKHDIPLTLNNIEIVQNFIENPFWFGQELNKLSKSLKDKFGDKKDLNKSISKKDMSDLKKGKSATELLEDLEDEIVKAKKEIIKLPENERQSLWKNASNMEKAVQLQKQMQKDEMLYQIPMQLHNGITNMNLYVMNNREGNGKLSDSNMRVFLSMDTETLGTVQIYMNMTEKNVSFQINSDNPDATKFLRSQQINLQTSIENLGYMVGKMQYGEEARKSPLESQTKSDIKPIGKNMSNKGFEAII